MQQKFTQEADFRQERDFGQKITATFEFLGAHWRPLGKCVMYFVVPVALLAGLGLGITNNYTYNTMDGALSGSAVQRFDNPLAGIGLVGMLLSYALLAATVYGYIRLRMEQPAHEPVTPQQVGRIVARRFPMLLLGALAAIIISMLGTFLLIIPGIYLSVALSLIWTTQVFEDAGVGTGISRSMHLLKGHWWSMLGLSIVMSIIVSMLGMVFSITQIFAVIGKLLHWPFLSSDVLMVGSSIISSVGSILLYSLLMVAYAFQYFNLVEKKEGLGMRNIIASLGSTAAPTVQNASFRPDDEGEY
ncbi:hypothetical protein [Hymenobacter perfusus]|uniref:DUF7847 domain-containing protein n=1 Tax=Hymenobacter perfusus TaxID=1236770 RepID=A0A428KGU2_9BACT|nr:hypothetical protein [Hymenobacter perfusus]RSK45656.1 hypothetical protein EI293_00335 [Hymenobacter perfusus]